MFREPDAAGRYSHGHGALAVMIGLLFWASVVAVIILYGGEVAARLQSGVERL